MAHLETWVSRDKTVGVVDVEWALILAFCNRVLRLGMEREQKEREEGMIALRKWRYRLQKKRLREAAYKE